MSGSASIDFVLSFFFDATSLRYAANSRVGEDTNFECVCVCVYFSFRATAYVYTSVFY